jgi:hypothetical protein
MVVSDRDFAMLSTHLWHLDRQGYSRTSVKHEGKWLSVTPHRLIWLVRVARNYVGYFACKHQAAMAYNETASRLFGKFANLNKLGDV